jgi:hypothetical protein
MRFLGLPLGFFLLGNFLFIKCGKDFRDYQTGIIYIKNQNNSNYKSSSKSCG